MTNKHVVLKEHVFDNDYVNFSEQDMNELKVSYDRNFLSIFVKRQENVNSGQASNKNDPILRIPLKIEDKLHFDIGKAYVGFVQDSHISYFNVDINSWSMKGFNIFDSEDPWNGLTIKYDCKWPASLVISSQIVDKYSNIFRLLFPIKFVQSELHTSWIDVCLQARQNRDEPLYVNVASLRHNMSFVVDNLWSYFHIDVLEVQWIKLQSKFKELKEFEDLRNLLNAYLNEIYIQTFLNFPQIIRSIFQIVKNCKEMAILLSRIEGGTSIYDMESDMLTLKKSFDDNISKFIKLLNRMNQVGNSAY